ncbi:MAG: hypothetical protein NWF04_03665 [Candidatus Bathyarchaeota archaeon]|nr:hypothetical protein [Candidatus Bathyarchaeota archaeon]
MQSSKDKDVLGSGGYWSIGEAADCGVLALFPAFRHWEGCSQTRRSAVFKQLACIYEIGCKGSVSSLELSQALGMSRYSSARSLKTLVSLSLVDINKTRRPHKYYLTTKGVIALMVFPDFQALPKITRILTAHRRKNDCLAFALLLIGNCEDKNKVIPRTLVDYAKKGGTIESVDAKAVSEVLLAFYSLEAKTRGEALPNYLGVFQEFTTAGFQQVLQLLLSAMKPTANDYNWLVEFFGEVVEFYYNPARLAYLNLLPQSPRLKRGLERFKKKQEQQITQAGSKLEVTFNVPSANVSKFMTMPSHLRAMATRLLLEPLQFINQELSEFFWDT